MAEQLLLEPVDVEEDSVQRITVDTFRYKKTINAIVTDMAGSAKQKSEEHKDLTELMTTMLETRKRALKDHEKQQKRQKKQAIQGQQAAAAGALQPVGAGASSSTAVVGAALPPSSVKRERAADWDVQVGYPEAAPFETWLERDHPKEGAFKFSESTGRSEHISTEQALLL